MKKLRLIALMMALLFVFGTFAACNSTEDPSKDNETTPSAETTETPETDPPLTGKQPVDAVPLDDKSLYSDPNKRQPDVYDPNAEERELKIFGVSMSDGKYAVAYGQCAVGALVTIKSEHGEFSVQSEGGSFAMRIYNPNFKTTLEVSQSYNGEQIGETLSWEGIMIKPNKDYDATDFGVVIGLENQGFFKKMIPYFENTNLMAEDTMSKITERYARRVEELKEVGDGCEIITVLVPSSMTVYPELVPEELATPGEGEGKFDQVVDLLTEAGVTVLDMRETLIEHKNDSLPIFYDYDSHWTDYGAYLAYVELFDYISDRYPAATPRKFDEFNWNWDYFSRFDMPYYFDICWGGDVFEYTFFRERKFDSVPAVNKIKQYDWSDLGYKSIAFLGYTEEAINGGTYKTEREELPDLYVFRSSFGVHWYDLLVDKSDSCTMHPTFSYTYNFAEIKKAEPDYIIYVVSEWDFDKILDN